MAVDLPVELILGIIFETTERLTTQNILEKSEVFLSFSIMNERKFQKHKSKSIKFCSHIQFHYFTSLKSAKHIILSYLLFLVKGEILEVTNEFWQFDT